MNETKFHLGYRFRIKTEGHNVMMAWISSRLARHLSSLYHVSNYYPGWSSITRYNENDGFFRLLLYKEV